MVAIRSSGKLGVAKYYGLHDFGLVDCILVSLKLVATTEMFLLDGNSLRSVFRITVHSNCHDRGTPKCRIAHRRVHW